MVVGQVKMDTISETNDNVPKDLHIAPMLDVSKPEFHNLFRILSTRCILWTEMVVDETIMYSDDLDHHLAISSPHLHPIVCQIGGRSVKQCSEATKIVRQYKYSEINLNVDCPSSRVSGKRLFGAILMSNDQKETCYDVVTAMKQSSLCTVEESGEERVDESSTGVPNIPISVKTRVGIETEDGMCLDSLEHIVEFIGRLRECGCRKFVIHARKCVIGGLTPTQNRLVPPLNYPRVYELCRLFPDCEFVINGGIPGLKAAKEIVYGVDENCSHRHHQVPCKTCNARNGSCTAPPTKNQPLPNLKGCMIGRACMENPSMFWDIDRYFYGMEKNPCRNRREVLEKYCVYLEKTYPRRCCDSDERITRRIPAPHIRLPEGGCEICSKFYGSCNPEKIENNLEGQEKISSRVIDRSLKPILGILFGRPKSRLFRRQCDVLSRDKRTRNCGPAYIIREAMSSLPQTLIDEDFIKTEDLNDDDVPLHISPGNK